MSRTGDGIPTAEVLVSFYTGGADDEWTLVSIRDSPLPWRPIGDVVAEAERSVAFLADPFGHALDAMVEEASLIMHLLRVAREEP